MSHNVNVWLKANVTKSLQTRQTLPMVPVWQHMQSAAYCENMRDFTVAKTRLWGFRYVTNMTFVDGVKRPLFCA